MASPPMNRRERCGLVPLTTMSTCRPSHLEETSRSRQLSTGVSAPCYLGRELPLNRRKLGQRLSVRERSYSRCPLFILAISYLLVLHPEWDGGEGKERLRAIGVSTLPPPRPVPVSSPHG